MMSTEEKPVESQLSGRVLIVDDNPKNLQVLGKFLRSENYELEFAVDGAAALEWLEIKEFDLVLLDINMPGMDGFDVCRRIRSNPALDKMPVFFLTAETLRDSVLKGFEMGAQDYITKPFDSRELIMRVNTHVALKKTMEQLERMNETLEQQVTERTSELKAALMRAEESDRLKTAFLMNMSHEIRTPLNGIIGALMILHYDGLDTKKRDECLDLASTSSQRLLETIEDILEISKIEAGESTLNYSTANTSELIRAQYKSFKSKMVLADVGLFLSELVDGKEAVFSVDSAKFTRILQILLNNAFKFTRKGTVELGNCLKDGQMIFYVRDTGIGIPADQSDAIFRRFVQAEIGLRRGYEGAGLGLSIAKAYVEAMQGRIWFESEVGKGTTFYFSLPAVGDQQARDQQS